MTAVESLKSFRFRAEAPAGAIVERTKKLKPTNHMRPSEGGAFPLPSMSWVSLNPLPGTRTHAKARCKATRPDQAHGCLVRPDVWANNPSEGGASADGACALPAGAPSSIRALADD